MARSPPSTSAKWRQPLPRVICSSTIRAIRTVKKSLTSHLASGTPGTVAGFSLALEKYGTLPLNKVIQPAIKLARQGITVNDALADDLKTYGSEVLPNHENSKAIFWKNDEPLKKGDKLVQSNLAKSTGTDCRERAGCLL